MGRIWSGAGNGISGLWHRLDGESPLLRAFLRLSTCRLWGQLLRISTKLWLRTGCCAAIRAAHLYPAGGSASAAASTGGQLLALLPEAGWLLSVRKSLPRGVASSCPRASSIISRGKIAVKILNLSALAAISSLTACASIPTGPSMMALPGSGRSFEQFRYDDYYCRQFAHEQTGGATPNRAAIYSSVTSAAVGAGLGAAAGAAMGGGRGAAIGAGTGLLAGSLAGTHTAGATGYMSQQRYDAGYVQCMYGKGHRVPVSGQTGNNPYTAGVNQYNSTPYPSRPPARVIQRNTFPPPPPPPPGIPPPPPPR